MSLTFADAVELLEEHHLLRAVAPASNAGAGARHGATAAADEGAHEPFAALTYDTRTVEPGALLVCKGRFRPEFLEGCDERGLAAYVAERDMSAHTKAPGIVVADARKALSLLSAAYFGNPQDELTVIGVTGTKGKTTTAYFTQAVLNAWSGGRCALFSSVDNCIDGRTYFESDLTTPESYDAFRMMRQAVGHGMRYLVMEVSSQAYKVDRVHGLTFDVGVFLNISPDHISDIEHPTFEDYLSCKRMIAANSRTLVANARADHAADFLADARSHGANVLTFDCRHDDADAAALVEGPVPDLTARPADASHDAYRFAAREDGRDIDLGEFRLSLVGDFNYENALAAVAVAHAAGVPADADAMHAMEPTRVSGRMELYHDDATRTRVIVDYAHNLTSVRALLDFVDARYGAEAPHVTVVAGSAGNKAYDRREEIVRAAQDRIARFVFTAEDTDTEPYEDICADMLSHVTNPNVRVDVIIDRVDAIADAVGDAKAHASRADVVLVIGKGHERWIKDRNAHVPYEGDDHVVERLLDER